MFNSTFLDVAIGLAFLFCMISLAVSAMRESIEALLKTRAAMLERGIRELVGEGDLSKTAVAQSITKALYDHPQIAGLFSGKYPDKLTGFWRLWRGQSRVSFGTSLPSYIPARNFSNAVLDTLVRGVFNPNANATNTAPIDIAQVRDAVARLEMPRVQRALLTALDESGTDMEQLRVKIERWFDAGMDRVAGWYRRETQAILFALGLILAVTLNIDAIAIGQRLLVDDQWRNSLVGSVSAMGNVQAASGNQISSLDGLETALNTHGFMIGAPMPKRPEETLSFGLFNLHLSGWWAALLAALPGYFIIALATTLGAPFWFDVLNQFVVIRSTVKPHEKSREEKSKDGDA